MTYTNVVYEVRPQKVDPHHTRIIIGVKRFCYPSDVGTPIGSLKLIKLIINRVVSRWNARFIIFDIKNFYLETPMEHYKYARIKLSNILQEFIDEYDLTTHTCDGWIYFEILRG